METSNFAFAIARITGRPREEDPLILLAEQEERWEKNPNLERKKKTDSLKAGTSEDDER